MLQFASRPLSSSMPIVFDASKTEADFGRIETPHACLQLVRAGIRAHWPSRYVYQPCGRDAPECEDGWLWEARGWLDESYGFIGLVPARPMTGSCRIFGPVLMMALKRDLAPALGTELIAGLMDWLTDNHICHVVHASHNENDTCLGAWLDAAGFLYTGCRDGGDRSMILIL